MPKKGKKKIIKGREREKRRDFERGAKRMGEGMRWRDKQQKKGGGGSEWSMAEW